jgi:hypothetical protein
MTDKPDPVRAIRVSPDAIQAMGELFLSLERILTAECPAGIDAGKAERTRAVKLLRAFNVFVERSWLDPRAVKARARLFGLATAIEQLNDGVTHPMLMKETRLGPKNDRHDIWNARKFVCAALECYVRSRKFTRAAAADFIASKHQILKRLIRHATTDTPSRASRKRLSGAILSWHQQFKQGEAIETVQSTWPNMLKILDEGKCRSAEWTARADFCLQMAREFASAIVLKSPDYRT